MKKLTIKKKKTTPEITHFTIKTGQVTWQLPAQKDSREIARLEPQPAHFSDAFKNSHTGSCGKRNTGPQLSLCWGNSHGYSPTICASGVQVLPFIELNKP